jgi:hypothetical protein
MHPSTLEDPGIQKRVLSFLLLVGALVFFGLVLDLWRILHSPALPSEHSGKRTTSNESAIQAPTEVQLADLESAAKLNFKEGHFQEARRTCDAILNLEPKNAFALELKNKLQRRKIKAGAITAEPPRQSLVYPVIHEHLLGACRGKLMIDEKSVSFEPEGNSKDGFIVTMTELGTTEAGDSLKIKVGGRTYRFKASAAKDKEGNRYNLRGIEEQLTRLKAKAS